MVCHEECSQEHRLKKGLFSLGARKLAPPLSRPFPAPAAIRPKRFHFKTADYIHHKGELR